MYRKAFGHDGGCRFEGDPPWRHGFIYMLHAGDDQPGETWCFYSTEEGYVWDDGMGARMSDDERQRQGFTVGRMIAERKRR